MKTSTLNWPPTMPNVVVDASTIVSAAFKPASVPARALFAALTHDVLCMSSAVFQEISEVFLRPKISRIVKVERQMEIMEILASARFFDPAVKVRDCRDPKDDKYLDLALAAQAEIIISSDRDLLVLDPWRGVRIILPAVYIEQVTARAERRH